MNKKDREEAAIVEAVIDEMKKELKESIQEFNNQAKINKDYYEAIRTAINNHKGIFDESYDEIRNILKGIKESQQLLKDRTQFLTDSFASWREPPTEKTVKENHFLKQEIESLDTKIEESYGVTSSLIRRLDDLNIKIESKNKEFQVFKDDANEMFDNINSDISSLKDRIYDYKRLDFIEEFEIMLDKAIKECCDDEKNENFLKDKFGYAGHKDKDMIHFGDLHPKLQDKIRDMNISFSVGEIRFLDLCDNVYSFEFAVPDICKEIANKEYPSGCKTIKFYSTYCLDDSIKKDPDIEPLKMLRYLKDKINSLSNIPPSKFKRNELKMLESLIELCNEKLPRKIPCEGDVIYVPDLHDEVTKKINEIGLPFTIYWVKVDRKIDDKEGGYIYVFGISIPKEMREKLNIVDYLGGEFFYFQSPYCYPE